MKLTDDEHILLLVSAGVKVDTAEAQIALINRVKTDLIESLVRNLGNIPDSQLAKINSKPDFILAMSSYIRGAK